MAFGAVHLVGNSCGTERSASSELVFGAVGWQTGPRQESFALDSSERSSSTRPALHPTLS